MKKTLYIVLLAIIASLTMTSCHSSEKNYREAYEKAMEQESVPKPMPRLRPSASAIRM